MYWAPPSPYACILLVPLKNVTLIQACTVQVTLMQACTQFSFPIVKLWSLQKVCIHAYHQIHMEPDGIPKKAITTLFGLFELVWLLLRHSSGLKTRFVRALLLLCVALHLPNGTKTTRTWYSSASEPRNCHEALVMRVWSGRPWIFWSQSQRRRHLIKTK